MPLSLVRVDDRLVHGQVVVGWVQSLGAKRIVVVDDDVAANAWQRELYTLGTPADVALEFVSLADAPAAVERSAAAPERAIVLVADVSSAIRLCGAVPRISTLNLGGLHDGTRRTRRLPYVYLSDDEADALRQLGTRGVRIAAQDVPTARPVPLEELL